MDLQIFMINLFVNYLAHKVTFDQLMRQNTNHAFLHKNGPTEFIISKKSKMFNIIMCTWVAMLKCFIIFYRIRNTSQIPMVYVACFGIVTYLLNQNQAKESLKVGVYLVSVIHVLINWICDETQDYVMTNSQYINSHNIMSTKIYWVNLMNGTSSYW